MRFALVHVAFLIAYLLALFFPAGLLACDPAGSSFMFAPQQSSTYMMSNNQSYSYMTDSYMMSGYGYSKMQYNLEGTMGYQSGQSSCATSERSSQRFLKRGPVRRIAFWWLPRNR